MKKLNVIPLLAVAIGGALAFGPVAFGQDTPSPTAPPSAATDTAGAPPAGGGHHRGERLEKLAAALGLSDAQKEQIKPIFKSEFEQMKALKDDTTMTDDAKKEKRKGIHQDTMEKLKAILTPEQLEKMKEMHKEHEESRKGGAAPVTTGTTGA